jgi:hypothetical protein
LLSKVPFGESTRNGTAQQRTQTPVRSNLRKRNFIKSLPQFALHQSTFIHTSTKRTRRISNSLMPSKVSPFLHMHSRKTQKSNCKGPFGNCISPFLSNLFQPHSHSLTWDPRETDIPSDHKMVLSNQYHRHIPYSCMHPKECRRLDWLFLRDTSEEDILLDHYSPANWSANRTPYFIE